MSNSLPRPSRPSIGPPTVALPALPVGKTRKSTGGIPTPASKSTPATPKTGLRAPSAAFLPPATPAPTGALPQPRAVSGVNGAGKTLRKTVSINSFPQPPRGDRVSSLPPSPLSAGLSSRKPKTPTAPSYHMSGTPSLLNGTGDGKSVARGSGARNSDGLLSISSPPQSRSSSAQDSYSTSATQYDEIGDSALQRSDTSSDKRASKVDGKGNVIVSVRVRPDAQGNDHGKADGEWMVDGRKSLIGYRGKEGGNYYYGAFMSISYFGSGPC
jgi:centromeric protein E